MFIFKIFRLKWKQRIQQLFCCHKFQRCELTKFSHLTVYECSKCHKQETWMLGKGFVKIS